MEQNIKKILLVDDNTSRLKLISAYLKEINMQTEFSLNGKDGAEKAINKNYELAIVDVKLPDIDGFSAVEEIRKEKNSNDLPIIFLTGVYCDDNSLVKGLESGGDDYLSFPVAKQVLQAKIKSLLNKKQLLFKLKDYERTLRKKNKELSLLLYKDSLTDAINKLPFIDLLEKNINTCKRNNKKLALLFFDIDDFKKVNDSYGHITGDEILKKIIQRIKSQLRIHDLIGRFAGDEFMIILNDIKSRKDVIFIANKINRLFDEPFYYKDNKIMLGASIGITVYPDGVQDSKSMIINADNAMYNSKRIKKNGYKFFE